MQYILLIYGVEKYWEDKTEADRQAILAEYGAFTESLAKAGSYRCGEALQGVATATTVRLRDGQRLTTDGPFAETREQLGGFYLVDAKDLDEALEMASRIPSARWGAVEVRPIWPTH